MSLNPYQHYYNGQPVGEPVFSLIANGSDITAQAKDRLIDLTLDDEAGIVADRLRIVLDDRDYALNMPANTLVTFELSLGYTGAPLINMGKYIMDEQAFSLSPAQVTLNGLSANMVSSLKSQKKRAWDNTTLGAVLTQIAKEHGLTPAIDQKLASIAIDHLDQTYESDLNIMTRLADLHGALAKPAGGALVFIKQGTGNRPDGSPLPILNIARDGVIDGGGRLLERMQYGKVGAHWGNHRGNNISYVYTGDTEPVKYLRHAFKTSQDAQNATLAEYQRLRRGRTELDLTLIGNPIVCAEMPINLQGFRSELNGLWIITKASHQLSKSTGYITTISAQRQSDFEITAD